MGGRAGRIAIGVVAAALLTLTGCSGDGNSSDPSGGSTRGGNPFGAPTAQESASDPTAVGTATPTDPPTVVVTETVTASPSPSTRRPVGPGDPSKPPATFAQAVARVEAAGRPRGDLTRFQSPSGNIYCSLGDPVIGCEIAEGTILDPAVCGGGATRFVGRIEFQPPGEAVPFCNTDTIRLPGAAPVAYGTAVKGAGVVCVVQESGVTCVDEEFRGTGFTLRQKHYRVWNQEQ